MSSREMAQRLKYRFVIDVERVQHRKGSLGRRGTLESSLVTSLRGPEWKRRLLDARTVGAARFLPGVRDRDAMRRTFQTHYSSQLGDTLAHAADARAHRFEFFGHQFAYGPEIDWQTDPVTRRPWPRRFHADVLVHDGDVGSGDVKHVWELSRQQYLIDLGKAFFLTGNQDDREAVQHLVRSWIAGNPYATGVNWSCALEPAFRIFSWLWAYHFTADSLDEDFHLEWLAAIHDHGRFIDRHLERYSSPFNHLIGEAAALYMIGACFPEFRSARGWCATARRVLEGRLAEQFYEDGGSVEQSTFYHHATVGYYLLAALTGRNNGEDLSGRVWRAIERGLEFSAALLQPDGKTPEIGGADDGKPIRMEHLPFWDFRPYLAIGAVLFSRPDFKFLAGRFFEDALWLLGPEGRDRFDAIEARPPAHASVTLPASGYHVLRSGWSPDADYVCVDCGEQAAGIRSDAVPNSMHGHADCLSVVVWLGGRRVLVDSGFYAYNCGGAWEAHFRETAAHNTARVDGRDQARHIGKMAWSHGYQAVLEGAAIDASNGWALGSHNGYARGPNGVTHRRAVWYRPGGYLVICDEFAGHGEHDFEVNFQFAPGTLALSGDSRAIFENVEMIWTGTARWQATTHAGGPAPHEGWICPSLGVRVAAPRLTLTTRNASPCTVLLTVMAPAIRSARLERAGDGAGAQMIAVAGDGFVDWIAARTSGTNGPLDTDGLVAVCRVGQGVAFEAAQIGGSYVRADRERLEALIGRHPADTPELAQ